MASPFQVAALVARPCYPNSIAWSDENLVAIASGHLITILNPSLLSGPRGVITIPPNKPFPIGLVPGEDISKGCLIPICLSRDTRPCARSLCWSRQGLATNSGCMLALCTLEGRVKLYRQPFSEFSAEWVEVIDISDSLFEHLVDMEFGEANQFSVEILSEQSTENHTESTDAGQVRCPRKSKKRKQRIGNIQSEREIIEDEVTHVGKNEHANDVCIPLNENRVIGTEISSFPCLFKKTTLVEVLTHDGDQRVWIKGKIKRMNGANALVQYQGKEDEWVSLYTKRDNARLPLVQNGIEPGNYAPSPKIRPFMDVGNLPEQISQLELHDMEGIPVEAWLEKGWVEGVYVGFNEDGLMVEFPGVSGSVTIDAKSVRLAPLWNCNLQSWQITLLKIDLEGLKSDEVVELKSKRAKENIKRQNSSVPKHERGFTKKTSAKGACTQISAEQYVSRSAMLTSTIVAWSPMFRLSSESDCNSPNSLPIHVSLLSVGGKSGKISFWKVHEPQEYSIVSTGVSVNVKLVGILEAHNTWITAICWETLSTIGVNAQVVLVSGSSDGSLRIWLVDTERLLSSSEIDCAAICLLKEVTGLTWAFNGCCLYSCSQDDSIRCWILRGSSLQEAPFPLTSLGLQSSTDLPYVTNSCFGLAISRGNLVVAVVRGFDSDFLNPKYQARTQKAAVEFFWIGGQELGLSPDASFDFGLEPCPEANILWSLKQYSYVGKLLVVWDVIAALLTIKHSAPSYAKHILIKWISSWFADYNAGFTIENTLLYTSCSLSKLTCCQLHLLNIISRRFVLSAPKADTYNAKESKLEGVEDEDEQKQLWNKLLDTSEGELRERLVALSFASTISQSSGQWVPVGIAQMDKWVAINHDTVHDQLQLLASKVKTSVSFDSPEFGLCAQLHRLVRCAVSMQICPITPLWHCVCCKRSVSELVPETLFTSPELPLNLKSFTVSSSQKRVTKPLCPFCGILLQRLQPEFLLSPSPV
ncbi:hypothetical protein ACHQM5_028627 [Ranunculus cassubicifolius]